MSKPKLLLVYPNQRWLKDDVVTTWNVDPRLHCQFGSIVKDLVDVKILDAQFNKLTEEQFAEEVRAYDPDYVGISQLTTEYAPVLDIAVNHVKAVKPDAIIVVGGVHVTTCYEWVMLNKNIDYACRGEGEDLIRELILYWQDKGPMPTRGLVYWDDNGKLISQDKTANVDVTKLPWPDYDLVDMNAYVWDVPRKGPYRYLEMPGIPMIISRGCPYECTFCQVDAIAGRNVRMRDPDDVVNELKFLQEKYGVKSITFFDDNFFLPKNGMKELLRKMIDADLDLTWQVSGASIWVLDDEFIKLSTAAGCKAITVAIESGVDRVLREVINKPIKNIAQVPDQIAAARAGGLFVSANFVIGSPGETWAEIRQTIDFAENCNADYVKFYAAVPLLGTKMREMAREMGMLKGDDNPLNIDWRNTGLSCDEWTSEDISALRVYEWDRINFQPSRLESVSKIWGLPDDEIKAIRKRTRDSLHLENADRMNTRPSDQQGIPGKSAAA